MPHARAHARVRRGRSLGLGLGLTLLAGCPQTHQEDFEDVGHACVRGEADQIHRVEVDFELCLSSSCEEVIESSCSARLEGTTLTIEALATVESRTGRALSCTADCGTAIAECQTPALAPGTYTLVYGDRSIELVVPAAEPVCTPI